VCAALLRLLAAAVAFASFAGHAESLAATGWLYKNTLCDSSQITVSMRVSMHAYTGRGIPNSRFKGLPTWDAQQHPVEESGR
jgi:hypothetical protein